LLAHRPQRRAPPVPTPVLVQKLSHDERILTELELGHTLSHDASLVDPGFDLARAREGRGRGCRRFPQRGGWLGAAVGMLWDHDPAPAAPALARPRLIEHDPH